jgi:hypothetical protein
MLSWGLMHKDFCQLSPDLIPSLTYRHIPVWERLVCMFVFVVKYVQFTTSFENPRNAHNAPALVLSCHN